MFIWESVLAYIWWILYTLNLGMCLYMSGIERYDRGSYEERKKQRKLLMHVCLSFVVLFAISY